MGNIIPTLEAIINMSNNAQVEHGAVQATNQGDLIMTNEVPVDCSGLHVGKIEAPIQVEPQIKVEIPPGAIETKVNNYVGGDCLMILAACLVSGLAVTTLAVRSLVVLVHVPLLRLMLLSFVIFLAYTMCWDDNGQNAMKVKTFLSSPYRSSKGALPKLYKEIKKLMEQPIPPSTGSKLSTETKELMSLMYKQERLSAEDKIRLIIGCLNMDVASLSNQGEIPKRGFVVMGNTGSGKSTFINYLHACKIESKKNDAGTSIVDVSRDSKVPAVTEIGHGSSSATVLPVTTLLKDPEDDSVSFAIVDTPGFNDNRGSEINIANAVNTSAVTTYMKEATFVLLIDYASVNKPRYTGEFKTAVDTLKQFFPNGTINDSNSILLLVNRIGEHATIKGTREQLKSYADGHRDKNAALFLRNLADNTFFYDPLRANANGDLLSRNDVIQQMKHTCSIADTSAFVPYLSSEDEKCVRGIAEDLQQKIVVELCESKDMTESRASSLVLLMSKLRLLKHEEVDTIIDGAESKIVRHYESRLNGATEICAGRFGERNLRKARAIVEDVRSSLHQLTNGNPDDDALKWARSLNEKVADGLNKVTKKEQEETPPDIPSNLVTKNRTDISAAVVWNAPLSYTTIETYQISFNGDILGQELSGKTCWKLFNFLHPGREYDVQVRAKNSSGYGEWSDNFSFKTTATVPDAVQDLRREETKDDSLTISWIEPKVQENTTAVTSYRVMVNGNEMHYSLGKCKGGRVKIERLRPNTNYRISIQAINLAGLCEEPKALDGIKTSNVVAAELKEKLDRLKMYQKDPDKEEEVYNRHYDNRDSDVFSLAHISGNFKCNYEVSDVEQPYRCNNFEWQRVRGGCKWSGNSQVNGMVIGHVRVRAKRSERYKSEIEMLEKEINALKEKTKLIHEKVHF